MTSVALDSRTVTADTPQDAIDIAERAWERDEPPFRMDRASAHAERVGPPHLRRWRVRALVALVRERA